MTIKRFCSLLSETKASKRDQAWFPRWLRRYAEMAQVVEGNYRVTEAEVVRFSRSLRDSGTPAWQRLQAVRAIRAYQNLVLRTDLPGLQRILRQLGRLAAQEDATG